MQMSDCVPSSISQFAWISLQLIGTQFCGLEKYATAECFFILGIWGAMRRSSCVKSLFMC